MKAWKFGVVLVLVGILACVSLAVMSQENASAGRGFGIGVPVSFIPWPFVSFCFSDTLSITATGAYLFTVLTLGASLEYRLVDTGSIDLLASGGGFVAVGVLTTAGVSASGILEFSPFRNLAIRASASISISSGGLAPGYGASIIYYFGGS